MAHMSVKQALDGLTVADVWDLASNPNGTPSPLRDGVYKSPFRVDNRGKSFSVFNGLKAFSDKSETSHKGGVWQFVALAKPEWSGRDIAREVITRAGGNPDEKDPNWKPPSKASYAAEKAKARDAAARRVQVKNLSITPIEDRLLQPLPEGLARDWRRWLAASDGCVASGDLAAERGWSSDWVQGLIDAEKLVFNGKGECVFAVERVGEGLRVMHGWHGRWFPKEGGKAWNYRPNMKRDDQAIAALPFVLGSVTMPIWIVCEGQWDAATVYGLLGGFDEVMAVDACVFGIRGASGIDVFLAAYQEATAQGEAGCVVAARC